MSATILVVEDEILIAQDIRRSVLGFGYQVSAIAASGEAALREAELSPPDIVLMDIKLKGPADGIETAAKLQQQHRLAVIFLTSNSDEPTFARAKLTGPYGYIVKPFSDRELRTSIEIALGRLAQEAEQAARTEHLDAQNQALKLELAEHLLASDILLAAARTDALTGAANRLQLERDLEGMVDRAQRYGQHCCAAFCDIDSFKPYNDSFGHLAGDQALRAVAETIRAQLRRSDSIYRYGGDEFLVLLPEQSPENARDGMERVRHAVAAMPAADAGGVLARAVTISVGIAELRHGPRKESVHSWISRADESLYRAKARGRNCVELDLPSEG